MFVRLLVGLVASGGLEFLIFPTLIPSFFFYILFICFFLSRFVRLIFICALFCCWLTFSLTIWKFSNRLVIYSFLWLACGNGDAEYFSALVWSCDKWPWQWPVVCFGLLEICKWAIKFARGSVMYINLLKYVSFGGVCFIFACFYVFFLYSILQQVVAAWHLPKGLSIKFLVISRDGWVCCAEWLGI